VQYSDPVAREVGAVECQDAVDAVRQHHKKRIAVGPIAQQISNAADPLDAPNACSLVPCVTLKLLAYEHKVQTTFAEAA
jgi:hypothetical protein